MGQRWGLGGYKSGGAWSISKWKMQGQVLPGAPRGTVTLLAFRSAREYISAASNHQTGGRIPWRAQETDSSARAIHS